MIIKLRWLPIKHDAITIATLIFIKKDKVSDALIAHEQEHVNQFKREPLTFWIKYLFNQKNRMYYEVLAHAKEIKYMLNNGSPDYTKDDMINSATNRIKNGYMLTKYSTNCIRNQLAKELKNA